MSTYEKIATETGVWTQVRPGYGRFTVIAWTPYWLGDADTIEIHSTKAAADEAARSFRDRADRWVRLSRAAAAEGPHFIYATAKGEE